MDRSGGRRFDNHDGGYGGRGYRNDRGGYRGGRSPPRNMSYRGGRSPMRRSPSRRSPLPRRGRTPPPYDSGYGPAGRVDERPRSRSQRRRSRSPPPLRDREDGYGQRGRTYRDDRRRSPAPYVQDARAGYDAPPRDGPPRDVPPRDAPLRDAAQRDVSPARPRERSPPTAAASYRQYSPASKHGRYQGNGEDDFERRDGPPPRDETRRYPRDNNYRGRIRSRSPYRVSAHASRGATPNSSRRSSPRSYGDRMRIDKPSPGFAPSRYEQTADKPSPRAPARDRSPPRRQYSPRPRSPAPRDASPPARSPPRRRYSPVPRSPQDDGAWPRNRGPHQERDAGPPRDRGEYHERNYSNRDRPAYSVGQTSRTWRKPASPDPAYPAREERSPPPTDYPQESYRETPRQPSPITTPSHPRHSVLHAPSQPRGGRGGGGGYPREPREPREPRDSPYAGRDEPSYRGHEEPAYRGRDDGPYRGGRGRGYGGPSRGGYDSRPQPGSRGSYHGAYQQPTSPPPFEGGQSGVGGAGRGRGGGTGGSWEHPPRGPPFRANNSSSTTYPRTQHFNTQKSHLSSLAQPVEGGRKAPSALEPAQEKRLAQLDEDRKKLMDAIEEKERSKRQGLRDWDNAERESKRETLKAELAEGHLEKMGGETSAGGAY